MVEVKIPRKEAEKQINILMNGYDVDFDYLIPEFERPLRQHILGMTKAITRGRLQIEDKGGCVVITQFTGSGDRIEYQEPGMNTTVAMEGSGDTAGEKINAILSQMSGRDTGYFDELRKSRIDYSTAEDVGNFFLFV